MIYTVAASISLGIILAFFSNVELVSVFLLLLALMYFALRLFFKEKIYVYAGLFCLGVLLGILRADMTIVDLANNELQNFEGQKVELRGTVVSPPKISNKGMGFEFSIDTLLTEEPFIKQNLNGEKILIRYQGYEEWRYGQRLKIIGLVERPENFLTDNEREFDYINYLKKDGISFLLTKVEIDDLQAVGGNWLLRQLYSLRESFVRGMNKVLDSVDTALMSGILLGKQDAIPASIQDDFRASGLTHIMVLSGYNINVVGGAASSLANVFFSKFISLGFGAFVIVLFCLMSGAGTATVRASIMALIAVFGQILGRQYDALRTLILVALIMVLWNPHALLYDPGFHLSFLASLGMLALAPKILEKIRSSKFWSKAIPWNWAREIIACTTATQLCVAPYFILKMGSLSIISLIANLLVLPIVPITMLFGFFTGTFGLVGVWLAFLPGLLSSIMLRYMLLVTNFLGNLPWAVINI